MSLIMRNKVWSTVPWALAVLAAFLVWGCVGGGSGPSSLPDKGLGKIHSADAEVVGVPDKVGLFFKPNNRVTLALDDNAVPVERRFNFGKRNPVLNVDFKPVAGDFLGTDMDTVGMYVRRQSLFIIHTKNVPGWPRFDFEFSPIPGAAQDLSIPLEPVIGDWDGDGVDTVGLYRRDTGEFFLRNKNSEGPVDLMFTFGTTNSVPIAGDWNGDGVDTVGIYNPSTRRFELADANSAGTKYTSFKFGSGIVYPLAGDWDGDGMDTVGLYDEQANLFHLKNSHSGSSDDRTIQIGGSDPYPTFAKQTNIGAVPFRFPIAGNWNTAGDPQADAPYDWETATPASQNIDPVKLAKAFQHADTLSHLHSLLVIRNGKLVSEEYFNGFDASAPNSTKSCTKMFTSALVGIAINQGYLKGVDQLIKDYLHDYITAESHPWKHDITIHHLLNMRSGISWDNKTWNPQMFQSTNWVKFYLDRPMAAYPGKTFLYASGCANTVSTILHRVVGQRMDKFAEEVLFGPLGIKATRWDYEPNKGRLTCGLCGIFMQPRDMARMGELYLNNGFLDGTQIVPAEWVEYSKTNHGNNYGNYWWHHWEKGSFSIAAQGYAGQRIYVTPKLNLVVVITSRWYVNRATAKAQQDDNLNLWRNYVLPAVN
jgi:CubicO group peptidase (beta-lactamase class C family)